MTRNNVFVGDRRVLRRYIGDRLIFDDLADKTEVLSGEEMFTDKADEEAVVHVEVDGKSYQEHEPSPDSPIEIHSLNDFDVVSSVGKRNLLPLDSAWTNPDKMVIKIYNGSLLDLDPTKTYQITTKLKEGKEPFPGLYIYIISGSHNPNRKEEVVGETPLVSNRVIFENRTYIPKASATHDSPFYISYYPLTITADEIKETYEIFMEEESDDPENSWTPAPEDITESDNHPLIDKINLLLDEPLRSVGDVKDRLFRDTDGLWKVERNVGEVTLSGSHFKRYPSATIPGLSKFYTTSIGIDSQNPYKVDSPLLTNQLKMLPVNHGYKGSEVGISTYTSRAALYGALPSSVIPDTEADIIAWFNLNPLNVLFQKQEPTIEVLPQSLQDKLNNLRSYKDSNYVYTVLPDKSNILQENLKPTLHATFKSIGWETFRKKVTKEE